jgi:hypothetical protein
MHKMGMIARDARKEGFRKSIAPDGTTWTPLKEKTIKAKQRKGGRAKKNAAFPLIRDEILMQMDVTAEDNRCVVSVKDERTEIAGYHQRGAGNNPVRKHIGFYPGVEEQIVKLRDEYIEDRVKRIMSY